MSCNNMNSLFETYTTNIIALENSDFDFFKSGELLQDYNKEINAYYEKFYTDKFKIPLYHCLPTLNRIVNDGKFRFLLVDVKGDTVLVVYKIIQILKTKQIRVFDTPISKSNNDTSVNTIIEVLKTKPFVRFVFSEFVDVFNKDEAKRLIEYDNYYYTREKVYENTPKAKLKKRGILDLVENKNFKICVSNSVNKNDATKIRKDFNQYLDETRKKKSISDDKEFLKLATSNDKRIKCISIYYKGDIVYCSVFYVLKDLRVAYKLYDMQSRHYDHEDEVLNKTMQKNMTEKMKYIAFKYLQDVDVVYILGCMPNEHRLIKHKEMKCEGKIKYYII